MRYALCLAALLSVLAPAGAAKPAVDVFSQEPLKAFPATDGWTLRAQPERFTPDTLYQLIDGEADLFVPYHFQYLLYGDYLHAESKTRSVNVELYRMGSPLDAFGIYSQYLASKAEPYAIGKEGRLSSTQLLFYKSEYFVRITASEKSDICRNAMLDFGNRLSAAIPGESAEIPERELIEIPGKTAGTERYMGRNALDLPFLERAMTAEASAGGKPAKIFVVLAEDPAQAAATLKKLEEYAKEKGDQPELTDDCGVKTLRARLPKLNGMVASQNGSQIAGVCGLDSPADGLPLLRALLSKGSSSKPCPSGR